MAFLDEIEEIGERGLLVLYARGQQRFASDDRAAAHVSLEIALIALAQRPHFIVRDLAAVASNLLAQPLQQLVPGHAIREAGIVVRARDQSRAASPAIHDRNVQAVSKQVNRCRESCRPRTDDDAIERPVGIRGSRKFACVHEVTCKRSSIAPRRGALLPKRSRALEVQDRKSTRLNSSHVKISYA